MPTGIPGASSSWVFINALVERVRKYAINGVSPERVPLVSFVLPRRIGDLTDFSRRGFTGEHKFPAPSHQREALRGSGDDVPSLLVHFVLISGRGRSREPPGFCLSAQPSFHGLA